MTTTDWDSPPPPANKPRPAPVAITEKVDKIMGPGKGGSILVHVGTNDAGREGTTAIVWTVSQNTESGIFLV